MKDNDNPGEFEYDAAWIQRHAKFYKKPPEFIKKKLAEGWKPLFTIKE